MAVVVLERALFTGLVTRASVKTRLGISGSDDDDVIDALIAEASDAIVLELGRPLARQRYRNDDPARSNDGLRLLLGAFPVDPESVSISIDGTAITDYRLDAAVGLLRRSAGWPAPNPTDDDSETSIAVTFRAGYVMPDAIQDAANSLTLSTGSWLRPTSAARYTSPYLFECTTAGTTSGGEPTWTTTVGGTSNFGTAVLTARNAEELPKSLADVAYLEVRDRYERRQRPSDVRSRSLDGASESYGGGESSGLLSAGAMRTLRLWRAGR